MNKSTRFIQNNFYRLTRQQIIVITAITKFKLKKFREFVYSCQFLWNFVTETIDVTFIILPAVSKLNV